MIAFLRGAVISVESEAAVLEVHGVGFKVNLTSAGATYLSGMIGEEISLHTHLIVREDDLQLYGFFSVDEINVFLLLLGVNGVGPRASLGVLSHLTPQGLVKAITLEDIPTLTRVPGVGKKIAQRIVLELKDKLTKLNLYVTETPVFVQNVANTSEDALKGLLALGYATTEAREALQHAKEASAENADTGELIKLSLRFLDKYK